MITVIAGTNRPGSNTLKVARYLVDVLRDGGEEWVLLDLAKLPAEVFEASSYAEKPDVFSDFQQAVMSTHGVLTVVPDSSSALLMLMHARETACVYKNYFRVMTRNVGVIRKY